ncbi:MAG: glycosyltransferase family 9 protein [Candidatus Omnitrophica bacterium]|nr:glycosyltransferase family 9 protein [Candidatus Omnitrophota bacterium]
MKVDKDKIKKILFITLSNIGDIILTTPAVRVLRESFPGARLDVMVGPNGAELFDGHPAVSGVIIYDKHAVINDKRNLLRKLRKNKYDLVVDMKNTLFPFLVGAKYRTSLVHTPPMDLKHKKRQHLWKLSTIGLGVEDADFYVYLTREDEEYIGNIISKMDRARPIIALSPGAKSDIKKWPKEKFSLLADKLIKELGAQVIMVGDNSDKDLIGEIASKNTEVVDLSGKTTLRQLASALKHSDLLVTNDSAPLHLAGAVNTDVLAIFGPTDPASYGPTGKEDRVLRKELHCSPCEKAQCDFEHECMRSIEVDEAFRLVKEMLKK